MRTSVVGGRRMVSLDAVKDEGSGKVEGVGAETR